MAIIRFEFGEPYRVALKFSDGLEVTSPKGTPQKQYSTRDGNTFYLDLPVAAQIERLGIKAGQPFTICRKHRSMWEILPEEAAQPVSATLPAVTARAEHHTTTAPETPGMNQQFQDSAASPVARQLMSALHAALEAVREAEAYSMRIGRPVVFTEESIRAISISAFIQGSR